MLRNYNTFSICHTDEHRTATGIKQLEQNNPHLHKFVRTSLKSYKQFLIDGDFFGRTSTEKQTTKYIHLKINGMKFPAKSILEFVKTFFWRLYNRNLLVFTKNVGLL